MAIKIKSLGVEVPGRVVRSYDETSKTTTLLLDAEQVQALHEELGTVVMFFDAQTHL